MPASMMGGSGRSVGNQVEQKASNLCMKRTFWKAAPVVVFALVSIGCGGEPGHHGTPSDPNEEQGNPKAQPEKSINGKPGDQPSSDKTSRDPHTLK
jgi:hypothetical protein